MFGADFSTGCQKIQMMAQPDVIQYA